ncbi:MAG: hypothetical protein AB7S38_36930 [Vulcanimicrobiota bacterium]
MGYLGGSSELGPEWARVAFVSGPGLPPSVSAQSRPPLVLPPGLLPGVSFMGDFEGDYEGEFVVVAQGRKQAHGGDGTTPNFRVAFFPTGPQSWDTLEPRLAGLYHRVLAQLVTDYNRGSRARASAITRMVDLKSESPLEADEQKELDRLEQMALFEDVGGNDDEPLLLSLADLRQARAVLPETDEVMSRIPPPSHRPGIYFLDEDDLDRLVCVYELSWPEVELDLAGLFVPWEERREALTVDFSSVSRRGDVYHFGAEGEVELVLDLAARRLRHGPVEMAFDELVRCDLEHDLDHLDITCLDRYYLALSDGSQTLLLTTRCDQDDEREPEILHALPAAVGFARPRLSHWSRVERGLAELVQLSENMA